jgi:hypothetical protein
MRLKEVQGLKKKNCVKHEAIHGFTHDCVKRLSN